MDEEKIKVTDGFGLATFETTWKKLDEAEEFVNGFDRTALKDFIEKMGGTSPLKGNYVWDKAFMKKVYGIEEVLFFTEKTIDDDGEERILLSYFPLPDLAETVDAHSKGEN